MRQMQSYSEIEAKGTASTQVWDWVLLNYWLRNNSWSMELVTNNKRWMGLFKDALALNNKESWFEASDRKAIFSSLEDSYNQQFTIYQDKNTDTEVYLHCKPLHWTLEAFSNCVSQQVKTCSVVYFGHARSAYSGYSSSRYTFGENWRVSIFDDGWAYCQCKLKPIKGVCSRIPSVL